MYNACFKTPKKSRTLTLEPNLVIETQQKISIVINEIWIYLGTTNGVEAFHSSKMPKVNLYRILYGFN